MIRDRSIDGNWWLMAGLFTICVVGWSLAFSFKVGAAGVDGDAKESYAERNADRTWSVEGFTRISVSGSPDVVLVGGDVERVTGNGDDDALDRLEIFVEDGELIVRNKRGSWFSGWDDGDVRLVIQYRSLDRLRVSGASDLNAEQILSRDFSLVVSGSSDIDIDSLEGSSLALSVSGSADVDISGSVEDQSVRISGSADYEAEQLVSETATVRISGSGDARISVSASLKAVVSGSGSIRYRGSPEVTTKVSGSGDIRAI